MPLLPLAFQVAADTLSGLAADTFAAFTPAPAPAPEPTSFLDLLMKGGWVMVPIGLFSVLALFVFVERLLALRRAESSPERLTQQVGAYVRAGDLGGALAYCRAQDTPTSRILRHGLERLGRPIGEIREAVNEAGKREAFLLEKRMDLLASAAALAPMLGFLGTVTGLIGAFQAIQYAEGAVSPALLASGMWEAMITTAAGLFVGIPALFAYNYLLSRVRRRVHDLEGTAADFLDLLQAPAH